MLRNITEEVYKNKIMAKKVALVDDEPNILLSLEFLIKRAGYDVQTATDGDAGLALVENWHPDLLILDVNMPKRDGFEVCQSLRGNPDFGDLKIIMLTAKGREVEREKGLAIGADDYVTKPFSTQEITDKVKALLDT